MRADQALRSRDTYAATSQRHLCYALHCRDEGAARSIIGQQSSLRVAVRMINDEWAVALRSQLNEPDGERLIRLYHERAYSRVFRPTRVQQLFNAVLESTDLKPNEVEPIKALQVAHASMIADANQRLLRLVRLNEPVELTNRTMKRVGFLDGPAHGEDDGPVQAELTERDQLDERFAIQLRAALPPEHGERLAESGLPRRGAGMLR